MDDNGYVVGWGTLTLINAGLAQGKGRTGLGWFLGSILLGPLATLAIVLLPPISPAPRAALPAGNGANHDPATEA